MDFSKRRSLFKRPGDIVADSESCSEHVVGEPTKKPKPIPSKIARKLGSDYKPRNFVAASASSVEEFSSGFHVIQASDSNKQPNILSADEKNRLSARILKAELTGNHALVRQLKAQLEAGVSSGGGYGKEKVGDASAKEEPREVILMKTDVRTGLSVPYRHKKGKTDLREASGEASSSQIQDLVAEERMTSVDDTLAMIGDMASKSSASQKIDRDWTVDDVLLSKKKKRKQLEKHEDRQKAKAVADHRRFEQTLDSCTWCIDSRKLKKHLIIATGFKTYLSLPSRESLVYGHCLIVPMSHVSSSVQLDEEVFDEIKIWRKGLVAMFRERDEDCVFIETAKNVQHQPHMFIECIPLAQEIGDTAPIYFKKAILECEKEWSDNKKLVDLRGKDIRRAVPKGFSYFSVDFGLQSGYAHVIEDENMFSSYFGKEIIGGMLDLEHNSWRKPRKESFEEESEKVKKFKELWTPFDWTERAKEAIKNS